MVNLCIIDSLNKFPVLLVEWTKRKIHVYLYIMLFRKVINISITLNEYIYFHVFNRSFSAWAITVERVKIKII